MAANGPKTYSLFQRTVRVIQTSYRRWNYWCLMKMPGIPPTPEEMEKFRQPLFQDLWEYTWADHCQHFKDAWREYKDSFRDLDDLEVEQSKEEIRRAARRLRGHVEDTTSKNVEFLHEKLEGTQVLANMQEIRATTEQNLGFLAEEIEKTKAGIDTDAIVKNVHSAVEEHRSKDDVATTLQKNVHELVDLAKEGRDAAFRLEKEDLDAIKGNAQAWFADKLMVGQSVLVAFVQGYKEGKDLEMKREDALLISFAKQAAEDQKEFMKEQFEKLVENQRQQQQQEQAAAAAAVARSSIESKPHAQDEQTR